MGVSAPVRAKLFIHWIVHSAHSGKTLTLEPESGVGCSMGSCLAGRKDDDQLLITYHCVNGFPPWTLRPAGDPVGGNHRKNSTIPSRPGTLPSASYDSDVQCKTYIPTARLFWNHRRPVPIHGRRNLCARLNLHQPTMYATRSPTRGSGVQCRTPNASITTHAYTGATRPPPVGGTSRGPQSGTSRRAETWRHLAGAWRLVQRISGRAGARHILKEQSSARPLPDTI